MYVKLFSSIYQGTLRGNSHGLLVFTNLLAHADKEGFVDIHPRAIAEEVGLTVEEVKVALLMLEQTDPESRTAELDGRRILRLDEHRAWGWQIVNYVKYREIKNADDRREQNREAQQRWRNKHAQASVSTRNHVSAASAHAEVSTKVDEQYTAKFLAFWDAYPKKKAKGAAAKAFAKTKAGEYDAILIGVANSIDSDDWKKDNGQYIPHPATWLNERRWEDEMEACGSSANSGRPWV